MRYPDSTLLFAPILPVAALGLLAAGAMQTAAAQSAPGDVVVVTGFRPESLAEASGSVTVIDASLIGQRGADHLEAVIGSAANVTMTSGSSRGRFVQMRGIGDLEQFVDPKHYPSVGVRLDGIDLGGIANAAMLFDVAQIDVLRGPQGTRLGAGALAGQVEIRTAEPDETFEGYVDAGVGDYGMRRFGVAAGGPLADALSGRVAVQHHGGDGYMQNAFLGVDDTNGFEETSLRAKLRWSPRDTVGLGVTALHFASDNGYDAFSLDNTRITYADAPGRDDLTLSALGLTGSWQLQRSSSFELNLSRVRSEVDYGFDEDWAFLGLCDGTACSPGDGFSNADHYRRERDETSLDLRWLGTLDNAAGRGLEFVVGLYAQDRSESLRRNYYGVFSSDYEADRLAIYGQLDVPLADAVTMTLGFRHEEFDDRYDDSFAFSSLSDDTLRTGEVAFSYAATARTRLYASLARGNKPGGVNTEASGAFAFVEPRFQAFLEPRLTFARERLTNLELGVNTANRSGRLDLRAAVFRMARDAAQLESWFWDPVNFLWVGILDNADGHNTGAEIDLDYRATDRWRLRASLGFLDTRVDRLMTFDLDADDFVARDGVEQTKAPSWQLFIGSEWNIQEVWRFAVDAEASDSQRYGYYHSGIIDETWRVNASLRRSFGPTDVTLWTRNLLDEDYAVHGLYFGNDPRNGYAPTRYLQRGEPRLTGVSIRHAF